MLSIVGWSERYEKADTRKCKDARWVAVPNRWDGRQYIALCREKQAPAIFGVWILLLELASRSPVRGQLQADGGALTTQDMADMTRMPVSAFNLALPVLISLGWIQDDNQDSSGRHPDAIRTPSGLQTGQDRQDKQRAREDAPLALPFSSPEFLRAWQAFLEYRQHSARFKPLQPQSLAALVRRMAAYHEAHVISSIEATISNGWQGLFFDEKQRRPVEAGPDRAPTHEERAAFDRQVQQQREYQARQGVQQ